MGILNKIGVVGVAKDPITTRLYTQQQREFILKRVNDLKPWYHKIDLGDGIVTPGRDYEHVWGPTRKLLDKVDYRDKNVLDLGSWDGYWAFEAETRGAELVVSSDTRIQGYKNLLFVRELLGSEVVPLCNVPVQDLKNRLSIVGMPEKYDIIHHFGLFYHLRDPMLSLTQVRRLLAEDGLLILETAFIDSDSDSYMLFSGLPSNHHFYGISDTWAPTRLCLKEILVRSFLRPVKEDEWETMGRTTRIAGPGKRKVALSRVSILAEYMSEDDGHPVDQRKVFGAQ